MVIHHPVPEKFHDLEADPVSTKDCRPNTEPRPHLNFESLTDMLRNQTSSPHARRLNVAARSSLLGVMTWFACMVGGALESVPACAQVSTPAGAPAPAVGSIEAPDLMVQRLSNDVLERIRTDRDIQNGDLRRVSEFVDATVMPKVDFARMTALAVGRNWRQATPEQQKQLMAEFRALLLRTYSGALSSARDVTLRLRPLRADPADTEIVVRSEILRPRSEPIQLDYRLQRTAEGWKIYDVNVLGIWLVESYRNQFAQEVSANGIDGLIRTLVEKNRAYDQAAARRG
jgi:phospholipid transport system substrate-binding protein